MAILEEVLEAVRDGKRSFRPASSSDQDMQAFQLIAKACVVARDEGYLDGCIPHQESMSHNCWYDAVIIHGGLSHKGETYLTVPAPEPRVHQDEIFEVRPYIAGIGFNLRALWRRFRKR